MNWSAALVALVPAGVVTVTSTVPLPAGAVAVMLVALLTVKLAAVGRAEVDGGGAGEAGAGDRDRGAARARPRARADAGHGRRGDVGELVGRRSWRSFPPGVVTVTSTVPLPAGAVAVMLVGAVDGEAGGRGACRS